MTAVRPASASRRRWRWIVPGLTAAGLLLTAAFLLQRRVLVARGIPEAKAVGAMRADLGDQIEVAEQEARSWLNPAAGLARLSRLYHANGFYPQALQTYATLREFQPREPRWFHLAGCILAEFGRLDEALPLRRAAVALAPSALPARLRLGDVLLKMNRVADARTAYRQALALESGNGYALLGLARCALADQDWTQARQRLHEAARAHPDFVGAQSLLATVAEHFGDAAEAARARAAIAGREFTDLPDPWLDALTDDCFDAYRVSVAAAQARLAGNLPLARARLERAVALAPGAGPYHRQLGQLLLNQRDHASAREHLEKAVGLSPDDSDAWILLITLLNDSGANLEAERALRTALAACPQSAALHYLNGHRLSESGRLAEALSELQLAKRLRPSEANAYIDLALVYFRLERIADGVAEMRGALAAQPGHPLALQVLARDAIARGDEAAARSWMVELRRQSRVPEGDVNTIIGEFRQRFGAAP